MILTPNSGTLVRNNGSKAQCIAQAIEVPTPKASQLILNRINKFPIPYSGKTKKKQHGCKKQPVYGVTLPFKG
jgi:hypothetical protein